MRSSLAIRGYQRRRAPQLWLLAAAMTSFVLPSPLRALPAAVPSPGTRHIPRRSAAKLTPYDLALQMRSQMEAIPEVGRTRPEYTSVMDAFRSVYHNTPRDPRAPDSIYAVAQLLAEQGRIFGDTRSSQAAVGQYEFLRQQYPTTSLRISALLAEGQIEQNDLHDAASAQAKFNDLLRTYPRSAQADDARSALTSMGVPAPPAPPITHEQTAHEAVASDPIPSQPSRKEQASNSPSATLNSENHVEPVTQPEPAGHADHPAPPQHPATYAGPLAQVTSIRHWSTPDYTRVVVQLGADVPYTSGRVANPDRIYFDLHAAHLDHELVGKSFDVTDNGYLKRIRVAQFSNNVTRVVLDVTSITDYSSFVLADPYRLIIDIRSRSQVGAHTSLASRSAAGQLPDEATVNSGSAVNSGSGPLSQAATQPTPPPVTQAAARRQPAIPPAPVTMQTTGYARPPQTPITTNDDPAAADEALTESTPGGGVNHLAATPTPASLPTAPQPSQSSPRTSALAGAPLAATQTAARRSLPATASLNVPFNSPSPEDSSASAKKTKGGKSKKEEMIDDASPAHAANLSGGERSLVRALGLKIGRIVIDAGHGGHDSGTIGPGGIEEKDVVLDVALRLGNLLRERLGADVVYTRDDDTFIPLQQRTAIANQAKADLFISIHANSSSEPKVRGVEVYYLNFTSQPDALEVAARENAVGNGSIYELSDLVKKITLKDKLDESREFAADVDGSLFQGLQKGNSGMKDRGVKKAPFMVLIGANMPSILCEIGFITNPKDAALMRDPTYDQRVAEALYRGMGKYIGGLSGMRVAQAPATAPSAPIARSAPQSSAPSKASN